MTRHRPPRRLFLVIALGGALALPACGEETPPPVETEQRPGTPSADRPEAMPGAPAAIAGAAANGAETRAGDPDAVGQGGPEPRALVVRADGPSADAYPVGDLISARRLLKLQSDDTLAVLFGGEVLEFSGPRIFSIAEREGSAVDAPSFDWEQGRVRNRLAGLRRELPGQSLWAVAVTAAGRHCLPAASPPELWFDRFAGPDAAKSVTVTDAESGASATVDLGSGGPPQPWPDGVPFRVDRPYLFATGESPATRLVFVRVDLGNAPAGDPVETLALLSEQGCGPQVQRVARSLASRS